MCSRGTVHSIGGKGTVVVGLTPLALLLQFQVLHLTLKHSVVAAYCD